jgi:hypothetical protein
MNSIMMPNALDDPVSAVARAPGFDNRVGSKSNRTNQILPDQLKRQS